MTRQEHEALAAKALAWLSRQWISDKELEAFLIATVDESTGLIYDQGSPSEPMTGAELLADIDLAVSQVSDEQVREEIDDIGAPDCTGDVHQPYCRKYSAGVAAPNGADVSLETVTAPVAEEAPSSVLPSPPSAPSPAARDGRDKEAGGNVTAYPEVSRG